MSDLAEASEYSVLYINGCKVIKGAIPIYEFVALSGAWEKTADESDPWKLDSVIAAKLGVNLVAGPGSKLAAWRKHLEKM